MTVPEVLSTLQLTPKAWSGAPKEMKDFLRSEAWAKRAEQSRPARQPMNTDERDDYQDLLDYAKDHLENAALANDARESAKSIRWAIFRLEQAMRIARKHT